MDRFTYQSVREHRPELALPHWHFLTKTDRHRAKQMSVDQLVARRTKKLLCGKEPDRIKGKRWAGRWPLKEVAFAFAGTLSGG